MPHTITIAFQTDHPLSAYGPMAAEAERYGFDGVTVYNDMLYQPAWLPLLEIARATRRVRVGPAAVNPFTCHPINIAGNIALIDEASGGRAYLGLARGAWLGFVGLEPPRPVVALREAFACVRHLLSQSKAPFQGELFRLAGGDSLRWRVLRPDIPLLLGSWGGATIRACAGLVGEVKIGGTANPALIPHVRQVLAAAARSAGRSGRAIGICAGAVTVVDRDGAAARALARRAVALYLPVVAPLGRALALGAGRGARVGAAAAAYACERAARDISDDRLARLAFAGTPAQVAEQALALFGAGCDRVEFGTPHGIDPLRGIRLLGERVLPALTGRAAILPA